MYTEKQIKGYAKSLRKALASRNLELSHAQSLELLAETFGEKSWNHLSAKLLPIPKVALENQVPEGWSFIGREHVDCYNVRLEGEAPNRTLVIECKDVRPNIFASLMQFVDAQSYVGGHVKMTAEVSTQNAGPTSLWMRVDGKPRATLAFDNMVDLPPYRAIEGDNDWQAIELVLNVPAGADIVNFGCMLSGKGVARFRKVDFEKVDKSVPLSSVRPKGDKPTNLGFH